MLKHVVLMKFKPGAGEERIGELEKGLAGLPGAIAEVKSFEFGRDAFHSARSYDLALVADFEDLEAMKRYQVHPSHQAVVKIVLEVTESVVVVDFEH